MRLEHNQSHQDHRTLQSTNGSSSPHANGHHHINGEADADTNGFHRNGNGHSSTTVAPRRNEEPFYGHDREEVTRILLQSLTDLGYHGSAKHLSDESGYALEMPSVVAFRDAVLSGEWEEAEVLLFGSEDIEGGVLLGKGHYTTASPSWRKSRGASLGNGSPNGFARHGLPLAEAADITGLKFLIRQQKYLELLEQRDLNGALFVLRNELTPLKRDIGRLHALSSLMMAPTVASLLAQASWDGSTGSSRNQLLSELSKSISPSVMIPEHRLADLFAGAQQEQILECRYHNTEIRPSLYKDHECLPDDFPLQVLTELRAHTDEVWCLEFSHDGSMLATAGRDGLVCVFDTVRWKLRHEFREHERKITPSGDRGVCCVAFSPDDQYLISCSQNNEFAVVSILDGRCVARGDDFDYPVTSAAWLPDSQTFVVGSQGSRRPLSLYGLRNANPSSSSTGTVVKNNEIHSFREPAWDVSASTKDTNQPNSFRITDVAVSPIGDRLAATTTDNKILMYNLLSRAKIAEFQMEDKLTSITFDSTGSEMLVNMHKGKLLLLSAAPDVDGLSGEVEIKRRFEGVVQEDFVIRSCFGGANEGVVVSGSEDSRIHIWRRHNGVQVAALDAHAPGTVNAVAWHPHESAIFASAGDDRRVRIWTSASSIRSSATLTSLTLATPVTPGDLTTGPGASRSSLELYT